MIYILLSSEKTLYQVTTQHRSRKGAVEVVSATLDSKVKRNLPALQKKEQTNYLLTASEAAYSSLNKLDLKQPFHALVSLQSVTGNDISFETNSSSAGLGYALSLALEWREQLGKDNSYPYEVFATGEIHASGNVTAIGHVVTKVKSACNFIQKQHEETGNKNTPFLIFIPKANEQEISDALKKEVTELGGELVPVNRLQNALTKLLGDVYDGDPEGRWSPFKGLQSFDVEDSPRFFGREKAVNQLLESYQDIEGKLLVVTGVSGSGKSSTIKAGLFPAIRKQLVEGQHLHWKITSPKLHESLPDLLTTLFSIVTEHWDIDKTDRELAELSLNDPEALYQQLNLAQENKENESEQLLIFIDQYEELLNHSIIPRETAQKLAPLLEQLAKQTGLSIMLSIRAEYLESMGRYGVDTHVSQNLYPNEWKAIVEDQAAYSGLSYEQGLAERIINDANDIQHALPIVEYLLEQLYIKAIADDENSRELKHIHYEELGGINSLISTKAESVINQHPEIADAFFDYFVGLNTEGLPFARSVEINAIEKNSPALYQLIQAFIDSQLVIDCSSQSIHQVKLAHDSLLIQWDRLSAWLEDHKDYLIFRQQIDGQFVQWKKCNNNSQKQAKHYLLKNKGLLKQAKQQLKQGQFVQTELTNYLQQSIQSKRNGIISFITLFIIIPSLIGGGYWWDKTRIKSKYYAFYATKWGVPVGVTELTEEQRSHKQYHYQIDTQGGKVIELSHRNSARTLVRDRSDDLDIAKRKYSYTETGDLLEISKFNENTKKAGKDVYHFSGDKKTAHVSLLQQSNSISQIASIRYQSSEGREGKSDITKNALKFNAHGYVVQLNYLNSMNTMVSAENGSYGYSYQYSNNGLLIKESYINNRNAIMSIKGGGSQSYQRDPNGNVISDMFVDTTGSLVIHKGSAKTIYTYDTYGNEITRSFFGVNDEPKLNTELVAKEENSYNSKGSRVQITYFGLDGEIISLDYRKSINTYHYDEKGVLTLLSCFDLYKSPKRCAGAGEDYHKMSLNYENGNIVKKAFYDGEGKRSLNKDDTSIYKFKYDANHNFIEQSSWGVNQEPVLSDTGEHKLIRVYDDRNHLIEISNYGINDELVCAKFINDWKKQCYAKLKLAYDDKGNIVRESYFGADNNPIQVNGYVSVNIMYDNKGNEIKRTSLLSPKSEKTIDEHVKSVITTDIENNILESSFFNSNNQLVINKTLGYAKMYKQLNAKGKMVEQAFFGADGKPILERVRGFAKTTIDYDSEGRGIKIAVFGIDGKLTVVHGMTLITLKYDSKGENTEIAHFGTDGKLANIYEAGYAKATTKYNDQGKRIEEAAFGANNKLIVSKENGYAKRTWKYNDQSQKVEGAFFGADNKLIISKKYGYAKTISKYNDNGRQVEKLFFGVDNKLIVSDRYGKKTIVYDDKVRDIAPEYLATNNEIRMNSGHYAKKIWKYDDKGNLIEEAFFGADNKLSISKDHRYAKKIWKYNDQSKLIEKAFFDADNNLSIGKYGYAKGIWKYDDKGNKIEEAFYGTSGLILYDNCYAKNIRHYDNDKLIKEIFLGIDGSIGYSGRCRTGKDHETKGEAFYSTLDISYDTAGNETKIVYSGVGGKSMVEENKIGIVNYSYDTYGNEVKKEYSGVEESFLKILEKNRRK